MKYGKINYIVLWSNYVTLPLLYTGEAELEERRRKKENDVLDFFECRFLDFYKAELKSEDRFVRLFTLTYCTVKTFQPPPSLHRDCSSDL